jgi:hypothetical protein
MGEVAAYIVKQWRTNKRKNTYTRWVGLDWPC